jgi:hypothetical protein
MALSHWEGAAQQLVTQHFSLQPVTEALNLAHRYQEGGTFRRYVQNRLRLVIPAVVLFLAISVACAFATIVFLAGKHFLLTMTALLLVPVVLVGSLFLQSYVFFSWIESRALARALRRRAPAPKGSFAARLQKTLGASIGPLPPVPWAWAAVLLFAPLAMLAAVLSTAALALIVLGILIPLLFVRFER